MAGRDKQEVTDNDSNSDDNEKLYEDQNDDVDHPGTELWRKG